MKIISEDKFVLIWSLGATTPWKPIKNLKYPKMQSFLLKIKNFFSMQTICNLNRECITNIGMWNKTNYINFLKKFFFEKPEKNQEKKRSFLAPNLWHLHIYIYILAYIYHVVPLNCIKKKHFFRERISSKSWYNSFCFSW